MITTRFDTCWAERVNARTMEWVMDLPRRPTDFLDAFEHDVQAISPAQGKAMLDTQAFNLYTLGRTFERPRHARECGLPGRTG